jgi:hypothetical protein
MQARTPAVPEERALKNKGVTKGYRLAMFLEVTYDDAS